MGISLFSSSRFDNKGRSRSRSVFGVSSDRYPPYPTGDNKLNLTWTPNPSPENYTILAHKEFSNGKLLVKIQYDDCTNYEGKKIVTQTNVIR